MNLHAWEVWLLVAIVLAALELGHGAFVLVFVAAGGLVAAAAAAMGAPVAVQVGLFAAASVALVVFVRPLLRLQPRRLATNAEAIVGRKVKALVAFDDETEGVVLLTGEHWKARSMAGPVAAGTEAKVVSREGMLLFVIPLDVIRA